MDRDLFKSMTRICWLGVIALIAAMLVSPSFPALVSLYLSIGSLRVMRIKRDGGEPEPIEIYTYPYVMYRKWRGM